MLAASEEFAVVTLGPSLDLVLEGAGWALYPGSQADLGLIQLSPTISPISGSLHREEIHTCQAGGYKDN